MGLYYCQKSIAPPPQTTKTSLKYQIDQEGKVNFSIYTKVTGLTKDPVRVSPLSSRADTLA